MKNYTTINNNTGNSTETKLYFKYDRDIYSIDSKNVQDMIEKTGTQVGREGIRVRVIVKEDNFESPKVQLAEYVYEREEPWKSEWWKVNETNWDGVFVPDETWELVTLKS